jgi:hypothetical protein
MPAFPVDDPYYISQALVSQVNPDSLKATLIDPASFPQQKHRIRYHIRISRHWRSTQMGPFKI